MNFWDWIVLGMIAAALTAGIVRMKKKRGSCNGCCNGCSGCGRMK